MSEVNAERELQQRQAREKIAKSLFQGSVNLNNIGFTVEEGLVSALRLEVGSRTKVDKLLQGLNRILQEGTLHDHLKVSQVREVEEDSKERSYLLLEAPTPHGKAILTDLQRQVLENKEVEHKNKERDWLAEKIVESLKSYRATEVPSPVRASGNAFWVNVLSAREKAKLLNQELEKHLKPFGSHVQLNFKELPDDNHAFMLEPRTEYGASLLELVRKKFQEQ